MALPGTHFRFALALADHLRVKNLTACLAGTLYPDSRWLTGVERETTHTHGCLDPQFPETAFQIGWHLHCCCDRLQTVLLTARIPDYNRLDVKAQWIHLAVAKMIQDRHDAQHIDLGKCLASLDHIETPNGEDPQKIATYYNSVRKAYAGKKGPSADGYRNLWQAVHLETGTLDALMALWSTSRDDHQRTAAIGRNFDRMVSSYLKGDCWRKGALPA